MTPRKPKGFIALMSAILISAVLLLIATGGSLSGFYSRTTSLNSEYKERTYALADACVSQTLLALSQNPLYAGTATTTVSGTGVCFTGTITKSGKAPDDLYTFKTRSYLGNSYTSFLVVAKVVDLSVQSQTELATY